MADAYADCVGGSLKLKGAVKDGGVKKRKKKKKRVEEVVETIERVEETQEKKSNRTAAQKAFEKVQEQRKAERILKQAQKTHKQRVEVSWFSPELMMMPLLRQAL